MAITPSIRLERLCAVNERELEFIDTACGPSHEPKFSVTARVGSLSVTAQDSAKRRAKHKASNDLLQLILLESQLSPGSWEQVDFILEGWNHEEDLQIIEVKADESRQWRTLFNSIGALAEFCAKRKIPLPVYEDFTLSLQPPLFKAVCSFNILTDREGNNLVTEAVASVKKAAKKKAADLMYELLRESGHLEEVKGLQGDASNSCEVPVDATSDNLENWSVN